MEKLKIGNMELDLVPMGINEDTQRKTRSFKVAKSMGFDDMEACIQEGMTKIVHIGNDGQPAAYFTDCTSLKKLAAEYGTEIDGEPKDTYLIELSTDASLGAIRALQTEITELKEVNSQLQETVDSLVIASLEPSTQEPGPQEPTPEPTEEPEGGETVV